MLYGSTSQVCIIFSLEKIMAWYHRHMPTFFGTEAEAAEKARLKEQQRTRKRIESGLADANEIKHHVKNDGTADLAKELWNSSEHQAVEALLLAGGTIPNYMPTMDHRRFLLSAQGNRD
jgi:hypothetical protein